MDDLTSNGFNVQIPYDDDDQKTQTDGVSAKRFMRAKKKKLTLTNTHTHRITHIHTSIPSSIYRRTKLYGVIKIFVLAAGFVDFFLSPHCVFFVCEQLDRFERHYTVSLTRIVVVSTIVCKKFCMLLSTMTTKNYLRPSIVVVRGERSFQYIRFQYTRRMRILQNDKK